MTIDLTQHTALPNQRAVLTKAVLRASEPTLRHRRGGLHDQAALGVIRSGDGRVALGLKPWRLHVSQADGERGQDLLGLAGHRLSPRSAWFAHWRRISAGSLRVHAHRLNVGDIEVRRRNFTCRTSIEHHDRGDCMDVIDYLDARRALV